MSLVVWIQNDVIMSFLRLTGMYLFSCIIAGRLEYKETLLKYFPLK